jgi:hypothetical protein
MHDHTLHCDSSRRSCDTVFPLITFVLRSPILGLIYYANDTTFYVECLIYLRAQSVHSDCTIIAQYSGLFCNVNDCFEFALT